MKSKLKFLSLALAATAAAGTAAFAAAEPPPAAPAAAAPSLDQLLPDPVIAKGDGFSIKQSELDEVVGSIKAQANVSGQPIPPAQLPDLQRELLDGIIQMRILNSKATDEQKAKGKEEAEQHIAAIKKQAPSEDALDLKLKAMGLTQDRLRTRLTEEATAQIVMRAKVNVTDGDVKKFYEDNPSKFEQPEMVRASHILLATMNLATKAELSDDEKKAKRKQIEALLKRARDGEDFAKLAKEYSEDPGSKDKGGEYTFPRGQMMAEFEAAAFSLKTNQISEVVTTAYGYHIIKLSEKIPAERIPLEKASPDIRSYLEKREIEKILPTYYAKLKKDANVEILDAQLKSLEDAAAAAEAAQNKMDAAGPSATTPAPK